MQHSCIPVTNKYRALSVQEKNTRSLLKSHTQQGRRGRDGSNAGHRTFDSCKMAGRRGGGSILILANRTLIT